MTAQAQSSCDQCQDVMPGRGQYRSKATIQTDLTRIASGYYPEILGFAERSTQPKLRLLLHRRDCFRRLS